MTNRILITSALPYINGIKHLGNLVGSMLPADVYARFQRLRGKEVLYICATDEHGTPAELAALEAGQSVAEYCREQHAVQTEAGEAFGLSFDYFGRSSCADNHALTQHFAKKLEQNNLLEERVDSQIYSVQDGRFLPDRYVEGTCPHCTFERARGDQCDQCGQLLDSVDLINPRSVISDSTELEIRETRHLYLLQSRMQDEITRWVEAHQDWPALTKSIALKWIKEGLQDRAITRDLKWGVPVAYNGEGRSGFEEKVFYVWFDAPIGYIAATKEARADWESWWRTDKGADQVRYVQFMGKDNVAFHTVSFPCTILGAGEPWKTVDTLKSLNWLTWYGGKFSTSMGRGIFMDQALEILPADYWRWFLMANAPESSDTSFTLENFVTNVNKDLADVLGNFVNRTTRFCQSKFGKVVPEGGTIGALEEKLFERLDQKISSYTTHLENIEFRKAFADLRIIWTMGNEYLQEAAPWTVFKQDPEQAAMSLRIGLNLIVLFGVLSQPVTPFTAEKLLRLFDVAAPADWPEEGAKHVLQRLQPGHPFEMPDVLFPKIDEAQLATWKERFGAESS